MFFLTGGVQAIAELLDVDHCIQQGEVEQYNITMRRYGCMALTNLTFGDGTNKALLCSMRSFMQALVSQLECECEDLNQVNMHLNPGSGDLAIIYCGIVIVSGGSVFVDFVGYHYS